MNKKGFTLIEILIVLGIIGLLGALSAVAINSARSKMRDAKRLADIRQVQSALEDHFKEMNQYPMYTDLRLGDPTSSRCLSNLGFTANCSGSSQLFMSIVPAEFTKGIRGNVRCGVPPMAGYCYNIANEGMSYSIGFELEHAIAEAGIEKGANCLVPEVGIRSGACLQ